jgi:hypothetical protein
MKRRGAQLGVKSVVGSKRNVVALNDLDRQAYVDSVSASRALPDNVATVYEAAMIMKTLLGAKLCTHQQHLIAETIEERWPTSGKVTQVPIQNVARALALSYVVADAESEEEATATLPGVVDAISLFEVDPMVGESYKITTTGDGWIDLVAISKNVREALAELRADWPPTLDEYFHEQVCEGGVDYANRCTIGLRVGGMLPKLAAEPWTVKLMDRAQYAEHVHQAKGRYSCLNPLCSNCVVEYSDWSELIEEDYVENGKVAILTRREESPLTRKMIQVAATEPPAVGDGDLRLRDAAYGFEVKS